MTAGRCKSLYWSKSTGRPGGGDGEGTGPNQRPSRPHRPQPLHTHPLPTEPPFAQACPSSSVMRGPGSTPDSSSLSLNLNPGPGSLTRQQAWGSQAGTEPMQSYQMPQKPLTGTEWGGPCLPGSSRQRSPLTVTGDDAGTWPSPSPPPPCSTHPEHSPMLYLCCTSRTTWVLADLRKIPSAVRAGKQWGLVSLRPGAVCRLLDPVLSWSSREGRGGH